MTEVSTGPHLGIWAGLDHIPDTVDETVEELAGEAKGAEAADWLADFRKKHGGRTHYIKVNSDGYLAFYRHVVGQFKGYCIQGATPADAIRTVAIEVGRTESRVRQIITASTAV